MFRKLKDGFLYAVAKIIFLLAGWKLGGNLPANIKKCVMIAAPHTSNWDIVFTRAAFALLDVPVRFTIKKEWFDSPIGFFIKFIGGIPIDRNLKREEGKRNSIVEGMIALFDQNEQLTVLVTPEGTRSLATKWKTGFYHVAVGGQVPIALGFVDYKNKIAGVGKVIFPTGDFEKEMREIMDFYKEITPKYPERFSVDLRYN
ncbi:MAG: glycerol acyltransferase [Bacteroidetes bacterium]|nr:MAG: glycerol acyltransferase [Bacteroidota bacterium]